MLLALENKTVGVLCFLEDTPMSHEESVDRLVTGLVREYLYRHGLTEVLHCFDRETGDEQGGKHTRTTTQDLVRSLRLSTLYKRNAQSPSPLPSVLDVLSAYLYRGEKSTAPPSPASMAPPPPPPSSSSSVGRPGVPLSSSAVSARATPALALPTLPLSSLAPPPPPPPPTPSGPSSTAAPSPLSAPPSAAPTTGGGDTFFARLAAAKAAKEAAAVQAPVVAVVPQPPQPPPPSTAPSVPTGGGGSFFERLAAAKAAKEKEGLAPVSAPAIAADTVPPVAAPVSTAASTAASSSSGGGGGGFFARLAASKPSPAAAQPPTTFAFTAPDGKGFNDRGEYRKYMFETFYSWRDQRGTAAEQGGEEEERGVKAGGDGTLVLKKAPGSVSGQPFSILDCSHCTLALCDWSETVQVDRCTGVRVFIAASCESVFLRNLEGCEVTVACKQLRTRDCHNCTFYLYAKTEPVVEASSRCTFAPFNGACAGLREAFASAALEPNNNHWDRVFDFSKDDTALPLPHWETQGEALVEEGGIVMRSVCSLYLATGYLTYPPPPLPPSAPFHPLFKRTHHTFFYYVTSRPQ